MRRYARIILLVCLCILLFSSVCSANPALFFFFPSWPQIVIVLVVVIVIETWVFKMGMGRPYLKTGLAVGSANILSTVVGLPLSIAAWEILDPILFVLMATVHFKSPRGHGGDLSLLFGVLVPLLALSFLASVYLEYFIVRRFFKGEDERRIKHLSYRANLVTYGLLLVILFSWALLFPVSFGRYMVR